MHDATAERLEMRWLPVVDEAGGTRLEATWGLAPRAAPGPGPAATHAA